MYDVVLSGSSPSSTLHPLRNSKDPQLSAQLLLVDVVSSMERAPGDSVRRGLASEVQSSTLYPFPFTVTSPPMSQFPTQTCMTDWCILTLVGQCARGAATPRGNHQSTCSPVHHSTPTCLCCCRKPWLLALASTPVVLAVRSTGDFFIVLAVEFLPLTRPRYLPSPSSDRESWCRNFFFFCSSLALRVIPTPSSLLANAM
ncbi:hypothetical protein DFH06DRAFT_1326779 [Mycena polygramma]|nr:hypothetical protein DFH06DRAFT_1326779 [Mycena polygramma]